MSIARLALVAIGVVVSSCDDSHADEGEPQPVDAAPNDAADAAPIPRGDPGDWRAKRLVPNAGFDASESTVAGWSVTGTGQATIVGGAHGGPHALQTVDASNTDTLSVRSEHLAVLPGETLQLEIFAQRVTGLSGGLFLEYWNAAGERLADGIFGSTVADVAGWQRLRVAGVAPVDAVTATVLINSRADSIGTTLWDDLTITSLAPPELAVPNGGFEEKREIFGSTAQPTQWAVTGNAIVITSSVHSGRKVLRTNDAADNVAVTVLSRAIPVTAGETITASVWAKRMSGRAGTLFLEYRRADGSTDASYKASKDVGPETDWQLLSVELKAPADATHLTLRIYSGLMETGITLWDDVELRSSSDHGHREPLGTGTVLLVGDQRVESYAGVARIVHPGTKTGDPALSSLGEGVVMGAGTWDANPRISGTVLPTNDGRYRMWYIAADAKAGCSYCTGLAESADGIHWDRSAFVGSVFDRGVAGVVENPAYAPGSWRYRAIVGDGYRAATSDDGIRWTMLNGDKPVIGGFDVASVTYDPIESRYLAMTKQWPPDDPRGPRTVSLSTSNDFVRWTLPRLVFASDYRDYDAVAAENPSDATTSSEVYAMPAIRYGEQFLGIPWMFDITHVPLPLGGPGPDIGRAHLELAASQDLVVWNRPVRTKLVTPGPAGSWDWGFQLAGTTLLQVGNKTRLYYSSFRGEHSCSAADVSAGLCSVVQNGSKVGFVTWDRDRMVSFHAAEGGGHLTTRTLAPTGDELQVNVAGELRVEVLDAAGVPIPGYTFDECTPVAGDTLATTVHWGDRTKLPTGIVRLRFHLTAGDLYSYRID